MPKTGLREWAGWYANLVNQSAPLRGARRTRTIARFVQLAELDASAPHVQATIGAWFDIIHRRAREWIGGLLDGHPISPDTMMLGREMWQLDVGADVVRSSWPHAKDTMLGELVELIRSRPFPWRRCPVCRVIFERDGKRRYCSERCAGNQESTSRNTAEHRERMRTYMQDYRRRSRRKREQDRNRREAEQVAVVQRGGTVKPRHRL